MTTSGVQPAGADRRPIGVLIATVFTVLLLLFLYSVAEILLLLFISVLFALYLGAITDWLQERLSVPRAAGVAVALLLTALGMVGLGYLMVPLLAQQTQDLINALPPLLLGWERDLLELANRSAIWAQILGGVEGQSPIGSILQDIGGWFRGLTPYLFSGVTVVIHVISVLIMGVFLAVQPGLYREGTITLAPPRHRDLVRDLLADLSATLRAWLVGQLIAMAFLAVLLWLGLLILGVPYALAFGVFAGVVTIVPFFGTLVATVLPTIFVLGSMGLGKALLVLLLGTIVHLIEANVLVPMVMQRQVHLPPVLTLLSVLIMAHLLHLVGLLVAVPVLAVVVVVTRRIYVERILEGKGFRKAVRDRPLRIRLPGSGGVLAHAEALERSVPSLLER